MTTPSPEQARPDTRPEPGQSQVADHPTTDRIVSDYTPDGPGASTPVVRTATGRELVVLGRGSLPDLIEVVRGGAVETDYPGGVPAEPVADQRRRVAVLTETVTALHRRYRDAESHLEAVRSEHSATLDQIRSYVIREIRRHGISTNVLNTALTEFDLEPTETRRYVEFQITGHLHMDGDPNLIRSQIWSLQLDLGGVQGLVPDTEDYDIEILSITDVTV